MTVLELMLVAHVAGDWLLQTEWQAQNKGMSWAAMLVHIVIYHVVMFAVLAARFGLREPRVYVVVAVLAVTHAILDRQWPVIRLMRLLRISVHREPERLLSVAVDQALHFLLLAGAALYLTA